MFPIRQVQEIIRNSICRSHRCRNSIVIPLPILQVIICAENRLIQKRVGISGSNSHHSKLNRNHQCDTNIECSKSGRVAWGLAGKEEMRCDDLANAVWHEEHNLVESVMRAGFWGRWLTPHVDFFVKPPMFEETRLMHMIYGIVFTRRTGGCQSLITNAFPLPRLTIKCTQAA